MLPAQGWKLHVSSFGSHAAETLRRVLPVLVARGEAFKVVASIDWLGQINRGNAGLAQIGKFITVYPRCEHEAVEVGLAFRRGDPGTARSGSALRPPAPSGMRLARLNVSSSYRFGAFGHLEMQTRVGEIAPAVTRT